MVANERPKRITNGRRIFRSTNMKERKFNKNEIFANDKKNSLEKEKKNLKIIAKK